MTNNLPAYSGVETHCTKCGADRATIDFCFKEKTDTQNETQTITIEYLKRTCVVCEYTWPENTLENSDSPNIIYPTRDKLTNIPAA